MSEEEKNENPEQPAEEQAQDVPAGAPQMPGLATPQRPTNPLSRPTDAVNRPGFRPPSNNRSKAQKKKRRKKKR